MKNNQHFDIKIIQVDDGFAYDIALLDEDATVEQYIRELDAFLDAKVAPCLGCDLCCHQRIPLTLPDLYTYAESKDNTAVAAFINDKAEIRTDGKALDIKLRQKENGSCIFLDEENSKCSDHLHRSLVCHTYICLPQTPRARALREALIAAGEDALVGELFTIGLFDDESRKAYYPQDKAWTQKTFAEIRLKDVLPPSVFADLR